MTHGFPHEGKEKTLVVVVLVVVGFSAACVVKWSSTLCGGVITVMLVVVWGGRSGCVLNRLSSCWWLFGSLFVWVVLWGSRRNTGGCVVKCLMGLIYG
jgi:hypothetical protein